MIPDAEKRPVGSKMRLFAVLNLLMLMAVVIGLATNKYASVNTGIYILLLFLICTSPLLIIPSYRGKASMLVIFLAYYFSTFALQDFSSLFVAETTVRVKRDFLQGAELAIVIGAICFMSGYFLVYSLKKPRRSGMLQKEWSTRWVAVAGLVCWTIGYYVTAIWQFGVADIYSGAQINPVIGGFLSLLRFLQPAGTLLLIYMYLTSRSKLVLYLLLATMVADFGLGFFGDSKELALRSPILYILSVVLMRKRLPLVQLTVFVLFAGMAFSFFSAYRMEVHSRHESRVEAFRDFASKIGKLSSGKESIGERFRSGMDYFTNRISLKSNVELLVTRVGKDVEYLEGETLEPVLYAFIPRVLMPDKPDSSQAGRLFNQRFGLSGERTTFISMSQLGELYWNFGWSGLVIGMFMIGAFMSWLAIILRLDDNPTVIKYLLLLVTIYFLVMRFEGAFAMTYTVWARLAIFLLLIHFLVPKKRSRQTTAAFNTDARILRPGAN